MLARRRLLGFPSLPLGVAGAALALSATAMAQTADERGALGAEIGADAATRTSLLTGGSLFDGPDGPVRIGGLIQVRYTANVRDATDDQKAYTGGFAVQYAQITTDADLNETWSVHFQGNFGRNGGTFTLDDAWIDWKLDDAWTLRAGQFKSPYTRERLISDARLLSADRSVVSSVFSLNRTQGVQLIYDSDDWRAALCYNDGANASNGDFNSTRDADYALTGRAEWKFAGDWGQLRDFVGWRGQKAAGSVGVGATYQDGGDTGAGQDASTDDRSLLGFTADVAYEASGWSVFGSFNYELVDPPLGDSQSNFGLLVQGGYMLADADQVFARYGVVIPDSDTPGGDDPFNTVTLGWNHFFIPESHASKFTLNLCLFLDATTDNGLVRPSQSLGLLESSNSPQYAIQAQYSATF